MYLLVKFLFKRDL